MPSSPILRLIMSSRLRRPRKSRGEMQIAMANTAGGVAHQHFMRHRGVDFNFFDRKRLSRTLINRGLGVHRHLPFDPGCVAHASGL